MTKTAATLQASGMCDGRNGGTCSFYFQYKESGTDTVRKTQRHDGAGRMADPLTFGEALSGLDPDTRYEYQVCGRESAWDDPEQFVCVGRDGPDDGTTGDADDWHPFYTANRPPSVPDPLSPAAGATGACDPVLRATFADAEDPEGRVRFRVFDSAGSVVANSPLRDSSSGRASWRIPRNADGSCRLAAGQDYEWRARAHDGRAYSTWSARRDYSVEGATGVTFDGTKSTSWKNWHACASSRIADLRSDPTGVWSGPVIRMKVRTADTKANPDCADEPSGNPRTQLIGPRNIEGDAIDEPGTASVTFEGFSVFIPASWPASISGWITLYEDYGEPYEGASDIAMTLTDGELRTPDSKSTYNWQPAWSTPMRALRGHWVNIVQEVKRSHDEKVGYVRQWYSKDRRPLQPTTFTGKGCASVSADGRTCYKTTFGTAMDDGKLSPRIGLYRDRKIKTPDPMITYFRAFKQGRTLTAVDPTTTP